MPNILFAQYAGAHRSTTPSIFIIVPYASNQPAPGAVRHGFFLSIPAQNPHLSFRLSRAANVPHPRFSYTVRCDWGGRQFTGHRFFRIGQ
jgi:hypothetical protein